MSPRYNWPAMVKDIMDTAFLPQVDMAAKLKVSQQSISNWLNGTRNPAPETIPALLKLAHDTGLDIGSYEPNSDFDRITAYMKKNKGRELIRIFDLYSKMGKTDRRKFVRCAEKMGR
ncbi:MAG: helix-turn-helix transcriptional regulator [Victivallales bacterium]